MIGDDAKAGLREGKSAAGRGSLALRVVAGILGWDSTMIRTRVTESMQWVYAEA